MNNTTNTMYIFITAWLFFTFGLIVGYNGVTKDLIFISAVLIMIVSSIIAHYLTKDQIKNKK